MRLNAFQYISKHIIVHRGISVHFNVSQTVSIRLNPSQSIYFRCLSMQSKCVPANASQHFLTPLKVFNPTQPQMRMIDKSLQIVTLKHVMKPGTDHNSCNIPDEILK